ncbi:hypothetical protein HZH66_004472 [Vespula vulgaris]|uniref:Uncharacterized protein n=1 Tax=Vespula vulgaris TaxID=7454 RepID=A0A834KGS8_VESVU|nr:hypothetical protein HZH66_004472 [Vespula vulgaris]
MEEEEEDNKCVVYKHGIGVSWLEMPHPAWQFIPAWVKGLEADGRCTREDEPDGDGDGAGGGGGGGDGGGGGGVGDEGGGSTIKSFHYLN